MRNLILFPILFFSLSAAAQISETQFAVSYLGLFSSQIVHRPLTGAEIAQINAQGPAAFAAIVRPWFTEAQFIESAQVYVENLIRTSGATQAADMSLPGNLGRDIARRERPYGDLVSAATCVNAAGGTIACDSGAPFSAGVLTTKAYLITKAGPFNIGRAGRMTTKFLCAEYPLPDAEEPRVPFAQLVDTFATTNGKITFGNGSNCYSCHSQFAHHAQFFVKFDINGNYQAAATGVQNPNATDGYSVNNLMTSHFRDATRAANPMGQILGKPAANLGEAGPVIAQSPRFLPCAAQNLMFHYLRLVNSKVVKPDLYIEIANQAKQLRANPSFSHLLQAIITNKNVFDSFKQSGVLP